MKKFELLADELEGRIRKGLLAPGERITSVREMAQRKGLSINTVIQAYERLELKGLLTSKPQSGFYVLGCPKDKEVKVLAKTAAIPVDIHIPDLLGLLIDTSKDESLVQFGAAYLALTLYPTAQINQLCRQVLRESPETVSSYELSPGSFEYRRQISRQFARMGCNVSPQEILATNGAADAVSLALRATCKPGDTVVTESPLFFGTLQSMEGLGLRVIEIPSHPNSGIDLDQLERALRMHQVSAAVLMPNFSNPLGSAMCDADKQALVSILNRYNVPAIEDEIYGELYFHGERPKPLKFFDETESVITCSSFSKTVSPGLRIGWIAPGKYYQEIRRLQLSTTMAAGTLSQKVMARYLASKQYEKNLKRLRLHCSIHVHKMAQAVLRHFPEGTRISLPQGGFVLWVELAKAKDTVELYRQASAKNITFSPGVLFSAIGQYRNFLRLNCGIEWSSKVEESLKTLGNLAKNM